ncbi:ABC transporter ATP-binding protein [Candidatus Aminicenantes bacterium AC-334-K16]|jgi:ABC-2 type transport system ATP-binding protein|nr:ABC transporter ATP-binding protein [Candidatus Aminicenantes bacterium AC-334-K16]
MTVVVQTEKLSKYYGNVLGLSDVSVSIEPGVVGLLGPNGAGKSTFLKLITGQLKPSLGRILVFGQRVWNNPVIYHQIGYCPEVDTFFEDLTGWQFLTQMLRLHHFSPQAAAKQAEEMLDFLHLSQDKDRLIRSYSRGMRQRLKIAQAIAHDPRLIILDEPLNGLDPLGRRKVIRLIRQMGEAGKTVIVSSHVLPEIEAMTKRIILIHQGKVFAQGNIHYIRELIDTHPHIISIKCDRVRELAAALVKEKEVIKVFFTPDPHEVQLETRQRDVFFERLQQLILDLHLEVEAITSPDDNLQAVFDYLIGER